MSIWWVLGPVFVLGLAGAVQAGRHKAPFDGRDNALTTILAAFAVPVVGFLVAAVVLALWIRLVS